MYAVGSIRSGTCIACIGVMIDISTTNSTNSTLTSPTAGLGAGLGHAVVVLLRAALHVVRGYVVDHTLRAVGGPGTADSGVSDGISVCSVDSGGMVVSSKGSGGVVNGTSSSGDSVTCVDVVRINSRQFWTAQVNHTTSSTTSGSNTSTSGSGGL